MIRALVGLSASAFLRIQVSVEERMACGLGACRACVVPLQRAGTAVMAAACTEGPVFDLAELNFEET
jgi:dihydroorotate dehydrogenase electron transfer subunit